MKIRMVGMALIHSDGQAEMLMKTYHELCHKLMTAIFAMCAPDLVKFHSVNLPNVTPSGTHVN